MTVYHILTVFPQAGGFQFALPASDVRRGNLAQLPLLPERKNMIADHGKAAPAGGFLCMGFQIFSVQVIQGLKGHVWLALLPFQEPALPLLRLTLQLEAALKFLLPGAGIIRIVQLHEPGLCSLVLIYWHGISPPFVPGRAGASGTNRGFDK